MTITQDPRGGPGRAVPDPDPEFRWMVDEARTALEGGTSATGL